MNYPLFIIFGLAPSLTWLAYYLRKDSHPEPNHMIIRVFVWGMLATIPVLVLEVGFKFLFFDILSLERGLALVLYVFLGIALVEEVLKFLVVKWQVFRSSAMDEPVDLLLYMVISALGFAGLENILILLGLGNLAPVSSIATLAALRFLGATFLHALASGLFGYFIAIGQFTHKHSSFAFFFGLTLATLLHGFFNMVILEARGAEKFFIPLILFIITATFISFAISKLKQMKAVCNI